LLIGAGLFVRTLQNLEHVDPGFRHDGVLLVNLDARRAGYKDARLSALYGDLLERLGRLPGVVSASLSSNTPLSGGIWSQPVSVNGGPESKESVHFNTVAPRFFETMGTPLISGRDFTEHDGPSASAVAIVNEAFVRRYVPDKQPLAQTISAPCTCIISSIRTSPASLPLRFTLEVHSHRRPSWCARNCDPNSRGPRFSLRYRR
jgi:hypothetical protein